MRSMEVVPLSRSETEGRNNKEDGNCDIYVQGAPIPPQILEEIFVRIDSPRDIGYVCPLVCHRWYDVLSAPGFWISYMEHRSLDLPPVSIRSEYSLNIKKVCVKKSFGRNLIDNPSGEKAFQGWTITENGGNRFKVECPPVGCADSLLDVMPRAFATSFEWCRKHYVVDLWKEGIERAFLDAYCPPITVSEYYTCRFDCASTYILNVQLFLDGEEIPGSNAAGPPRRTHLFPPRNRELHVPEGDKTTSTSITRVRMMEQWAAAEWEKIEHTFVDYPEGIRYVLFDHGGKDNQFWAGHYGPKMTRASIVVSYGNGQRRHVL